MHMLETVMHAKPDLENKTVCEKHVGVVAVRAKTRIDNVKIHNKGMNTRDQRSKMRYKSLKVDE